MQSTPRHAPRDAATNVVGIRQHRAAVEFAKALSTVFNPFLCASAVFIIVSHAYSHSTREFWVLSAVSVFAYTVAPLLCLVFLYVTGRVTDFEMSDRFEREKLFLVIVVIDLLAAVAYSLAQLPTPLRAMAWGYCASALGIMVITRYWKISTHAFGITGPFAILFGLFRLQALPYVALVPLVCWARLYLRAHTLAQVLGGVILALATTVAFFRLFHLI